jgi:hypothetical protein
MTKKKDPNDLQKSGRKSLFKREYIEQIGKLCEFGKTDDEIAYFFNISPRTFDNWKSEYPELMRVLKAGKAVSDQRVERSLYNRAVGYNYEAVKIFMPANREKPVYAPYIEHVPPDVTAAIFWLKNRDPQHWRDSQQLEHVLGKYIISDTPMSEEQWARERATVLDEEPRFGDGREERHLEAAKALVVTPEIPKGDGQSTKRP